jgi:hypothetical protein
LRIKSARFQDPLKLSNVRNELEILDRARHERIPETPEILNLTDQLAGINGELWDVEDSLRACEANGDFSMRFVELARSVYRLNGIRTDMKKRLNELLDSPIREEKEYSHLK